MLFSETGIDCLLLKPYVTYGISLVSKRW
ncbi:protein of unknown function [Candidatus Methylocalor cossyra]|uniref:Uncharacterized protein n=1 Tax=Candidatus Methylocalor cossyra TaxID=3108543 RepID=A0ABM9NEF4_9GAMM